MDLNQIVRQVDSILKFYNTSDNWTSPIDMKYKKSLIKLVKKIDSKFPKVKYIGDIEISDNEYELLRTYLHYIVPNMNPKYTKFHLITSYESIFPVAVANVAIRTYQDGNFWTNFCNEIGVNNTNAVHENVGDKFIGILKTTCKANVGDNKYFDNILLHCYISNNYAKAYFDFLYKFYDLDIDRNIEALTKDLVDDLVSSAAKDDGKNRTYKLVKHISQAIASNERGAKTRLRNHLKLMDKLFWNENYSPKTTNRLKLLLCDWFKEIESSDPYFRTSHTKGKKYYSEPYFTFDQSRNTTYLNLPSQIIKAEPDEEVFWKISGPTNIVIQPNTKASFVGFKTIEETIELNISDIFSEFKFTLETSRGTGKKPFRIKEGTVRFFDENGMYIRARNLKDGVITAITLVENDITSTALNSRSYNIDDVKVYDFLCEIEDIIKLPNGKAIVVGHDDVKNSLQKKGIKKGVHSIIDGTYYDVYSSAPNLVLRMKKEKASGTKITINGASYRLLDLNPTSFDIDDKTYDTGYYINISNCISSLTGIIQIFVDIPGNTINNSYNFIYIPELDFEFIDAPYVFETKGTFSLLGGQNIYLAGKAIKTNEPYDFEFIETGKTYNLQYLKNNVSIPLYIPIPAVFTKDENGDWTSERPSLIWHTKFPSTFEIDVPSQKIELSMDIEDDNTDILKEEFRKPNSAESFTCDLTKFKSYLDTDELFKSIHLKFDDVSTPLLKIMRHSHFESSQIIGDFESNILSISSQIIGESNYSVDIYKDSKPIALNVPLDEGFATLQCELKNGTYESIFYEEDEDESGFGSERVELKRVSQSILNPYDMSNRSFKILQLERNDNKNIVRTFGSLSYFVENLKKTEDQQTYEGIMVVEDTLKHVIAAFTVYVLFDDLSAPNYTYIYMLDEYCDQVEFLYDNRRFALLKDENLSLNKSTRYRRYESIYDGDYYYHIEFVERSQRSYLGVPDTFELKEKQLFER